MEASQPTTHTAHTLLIADDESFIRQAYKDGFERAGYAVLTAENGADALTQLHAGATVDLLLLDLVMPKLNGFEVLKAMKSGDSLRHIKVIVLSNLSQPSDEAEVLALGAQKFLVKSDYSLQSLKQIVAEILTAA